MSAATPKLGYGRALSRAGALPPIGPLALILGLGVGVLLVAHHVMKRGGGNA